MTKAEVVHRLLEEGHITPEEAVVLLQEKERVVEKIIPNPITIPENPWIGPGIFPDRTNPYEITGEEDLVPYGELCSCNPKNGGSGICGCVMANKLVPKNRNNRGNWITTTTDLNIKTTGSCPNGPGQCFCTGACKE